MAKWVKGQSGNPNGRPKKGHSISDVMQEMLANTPERKRELAEVAFQKAKEGDMVALKLIWNYMDGMPQQKIEHSADVGEILDALESDYEQLGRKAREQMVEDEQPLQNQG